METRANFVLIGAFALAGFFGILAFFLWFAQIELDRQFAYYDIDFESVSGLAEASDVRFAGLPVGQVVDVRLSPERDGRVRVRVEIGATTPVRTDSVATIEPQGVTGVAFVGISAGSPEAPLLTEASDADIPMIEAGQSVLQSLSEDAPEILSEVLAVVRDLRELFNPENQRRIEATLSNVETSSAAFADALEDFSEVSDTVADFAGEIGRFNTTLDRLTGDVAEVIAAAETTLASIDALAQDTRGLIASGEETLAAVQAPIAAAEGYLADDLGPATRQVRDAVAQIEARIATLADSADTMIATYARTGEVAEARLTEARATIEATNALIADFDATLATIDAAAAQVDTLFAEDGQALVAELRAATADAAAVIATIGETAETDLPAIVEEIRSSSQAASALFETLNTEAEAVSGRVGPLIGSAEATLADLRDSFARANETLTAINAALETGDGALAAAERAFEGADRVLNEEVAAITERLRGTLDTLEAAIGEVSAEIPGVVADLRSASQSAESAFAEIGRSVDASAPSIRDFATTALPQYGRLAAETRELIDNLDALVEQIRRDPSRFFLDPRAPEYRR